MAPSTFRQTVADVAARAKERLPASINGRLEGAVKLVLGRDVEPQADGSILVGSSSDPMKQYRLEGATCTCQDFAHGKDTGGWCQHRIAANLQRSVERVLARSTTVAREAEVVLPEPMEPFPDNDAEGDPEPQPSAPAPAPLPEAPVSLNVRLIISGRDCQLTLRGMDELEVLARLERLLARYPVPDAPAPAPQAPAVRALGWCAVHHVQMQQHTNAKGSWFSHFIDGRHCKGR